ncbi:MAG: Crp/Fnr family transcriptional regulator [Burkholderiales bacterium]|nr:MAG: Crp/Fnr family transcriptional regulator [Burkholderiales bacterium]
MSDPNQSFIKRMTPRGAVPPAARKLSRLAHLSDDDLKLLGSLKKCTIAPGNFIGTEKTADQAWILVSGWCARIPAPDVPTLQITSLMLPGDGFGFACTPWAGDTLPVRAITECAIVDATSVRHAIRMRAPAHIRLNEACQRSEWLEQSYLLNHITRLGRRNLYARVAHFLIEVHARLSDVGLVKNGSFDLPLTQRVLAEMLGLSGVHLNRITRAMKRDHLVDFPRGCVHVPDAEKLAIIAEFVPMQAPFGAKLLVTT